MSERELDRIMILRNVEAKSLSLVKASEVMALSGADDSVLRSSKGLGLVGYKKTKKAISFSVSLSVGKSNLEEVFSIIKNKIEAEICG